MTLYYTKIGKASLTEMLGKTESELLEKEKDSHRRWLKDATYRQIESRFAMNDSAAAYAASQPNTNAALVFTDLGICPYGLLGCDIGGEIIKDNKNPNKRLYGNVPGFPEKNCVRCRFLLTSYAFLPGLVRRKKRSLELIHQICLEQYERGSKDFSIAMIGRLSEKQGGPKTQSIRNKGGAEFRTLIKTWEKNAGGSSKKISNRKMINIKVFFKKWNALTTVQFSQLIYPK